MAKVICISGKAQHGKNTLAELLKSILTNCGERVLIVQYGDYVKDIARRYFGWDGLKDKEGREILQLVGTDLVRNRDSDFWARSLRDLMKVLNEDYDYFIIPDVRFINEIYMLEPDFDVMTVRVNRMGYDNPCMTEEQKKHPSETGLDSFEFDYYIDIPDSKSQKEYAFHVAHGIWYLLQLLDENTDVVKQALMTDFIKNNIRL